VFGAVIGDDCIIGQNKIYIHRSFPCQADPESC
jgi:hypothetical protein